MQETWVRSLGQEDPLKEGRKWQPLQYSCPENSLDRGYSPWGPKESDTTKQLTRMHIHTYTYIHIHTHTYTYIYIAAVVQLPSHIQLFVTPWIAACQAASLKVFPSSCPLHQWYHPSISSSDALFSSWPQSFPASETFPISQLFPSGDQSTGASASASVLLTSIQGWFPLSGLISLLSKRLSRVFSSTTVRRHQFFGALPSLRSSSHNCTWPLGRP